MRSYRFRQDGLLSGSARVAPSTGRTFCGPCSRRRPRWGLASDHSWRSCTALGVGQSADWPASVLALRRWFPKRERAKGNSVLLGGLYLGPIIAAPITTAVMLSFGWRFVFYAFGVIGILLGFAWWTVFRDDPASHPRVSPEEARLILSERELEAEATPPGALGMLFSSGQFWAIGLEYFFLILI